MHKLIQLLMFRHQRAAEDLVWLGALWSLCSKQHFFAMDTAGIGLCTKGTTNGHKHGLGTVPHFSNIAETKTEADCINYFVILGAMCIEKKKKKKEYRQQQQLQSWVLFFFTLASTALYGERTVSFWGWADCNQCFRFCQGLYICFAICTLKWVTLTDNKWCTIILLR